MTTTEQGHTSGPPADTLRVTGIEVFAHHGVLEAERRGGQVFRVDLALGVDTAAAADADDLTQTVDYGSLVTEVAAAVASDPVDLIETVAERVAGVCLARAGVLWAEVTVHKPHAPIPVTFEDVALTIRRKRRGTRRRA